MPDELELALRKLDQARGDLYTIADDLELIKSHFEHLDPKGMAQTTLIMMIGSAALVILWIEAFVP